MEQIKYQATRLEDFAPWEGSDSLENLIIWGVDPLRCFCEAIETDLRGDPAHRVSLHLLNEIGARLEDMEKLIKRYMDEMSEEG